jgi:predicted nucleotidyltransferase
MSTSTFEHDVATMRAFVERKVAATKANNEARWLQAKKDADVIIDMIKADYQPEAIYQWGSVLDRDQFSSISDIDIAVEGLKSAEKFFALLGKAETLTRLPLDIVEMEHVEPEYAYLIKTYGRCVWKRGNHE